MQHLNIAKVDDSFNILKNVLVSEVTLDIVLSICINIIITINVEITSIPVVATTATTKW